MSKSRPASNPVSYHKYTGQYYVTRLGKRIYLGSDRDQALRRHHEIGLGVETVAPEGPASRTLTLKELANRFIATQRANWRNPEETVKCYTGWLGRFLADRSGVRATEFTVERFASWKLSLKERGYSAESINHYLGAARAMFRFAEDTGLLEKIRRLSRVRNESEDPASEKPLYDPAQLRKLLDRADRQFGAMIMLALNCGFGPKYIDDLTWDHIKGDRVTLPRSKTGISQTFMLWPETCKLPEGIRSYREQRLTKARKPASDVPVTAHSGLHRLLQSDISHLTSPGYVAEPCSIIVPAPMLRLPHFEGFPLFPGGCRPERDAVLPRPRQSCNEIVKPQGILLARQT